MLDHVPHPLTPAPFIPAPREQQVIEAFTAAAGPLAADSGLSSYLSDVAGRCGVLTGADAAVVTLAGGDGQEGLTACWPAGSSVAALFTRPGTPGPHEEAARAAVRVAQPDLAVPDPRWVKFAALALNSGYRAVYALPLGPHPDTVGVLSLLRVLPGRMAAGDLDLCGALADVAGLRLAAAGRAARGGQATLAG